MSQVVIRLAEISDLPDIISILNEAIAVGLATGFMTEQKIEKRKNWFYEHTSDEYPVYMAVINNEIVGWLSVSPYREGREIFRHTKEVSYYVAKKQYRNGVATIFLQYAFKELANLK